MYYSKINNCDIANGEGVRVTLFVSGCTNRCENCFQPETWNFEYGEEFTRETEDEIIELLRPDYIKGLTLLGGEPMEPQNQRRLVQLVRRVKNELPDKNIWCFSGFTYELLHEDGSHPRCEVTDDMLSMIDVLVDGKFVQALKNPGLMFRGSSNQRVIDMNKTRESGEIVLVPERNRKSIDIVK